MSENTRDCVPGPVMLQVENFQSSLDHNLFLLHVSYQNGKMEEWNRIKDVFMLLVLVGCRLAVVGKNWLSSGMVYYEGTVNIIHFYVKSLVEQ